MERSSAMVKQQLEDESLFSKSLPIELIELSGEKTISFDTAGFMCQP